MTPKLTYAIGDLHGHLDLLERGIATIDAHAGDWPHRIIYLGDYVDRGPSSNQLLERLIGLETTADPASREVVCLMGNHETMMLMACLYGALIEFWLENGGAETLESYGHAKFTYDKDGELMATPVRDLTLVFQHHLDWCRRRPLTFQEADRFFVHAGVEPDTPCAEQRDDENTLLWIREKFLRAEPKGSRRPFDRHIVHGHTPKWDGKPVWSMPELLSYRTNLDTGSYNTGVSGIGVFETARPGGPIEVLMVRGDAR